MMTMYIHAGAGAKLRALRGKNRSQAEVAKAVGVCQQAIAKYERGEVIPSDDIKVKLAEYYAVKVSDIFYGGIQL